ncbi:hypothetical protein CSUI_000190 [Cystoisospora suis]|uniref:Transmembrane protein n=1 Tax=Cystoisospora suis TaxID=483139 RepID=A0A2C6LHE4_9APIC|nr:hypothetical protein CSUI_000190 [Cystoisospora suis]
MQLVPGVSVVTAVGCFLVSLASAEEAATENTISPEIATASAVEDGSPGYEESTSERELTYGHGYYPGPVYQAPAAYYAPRPYYYFGRPRSYVRYLGAEKAQSQATEPEVVADPEEDLEGRSLGHRHHGPMYYGGYYGLVGYGPVVYPPYGYFRYLKGMRRAAVASTADQDMPKRVAAARKMGHRRHGYYYAPMSYYRPYYGYYSSPYGYVRYLRRAEGAGRGTVSDSASVQSEERQLSPHHRGYYGGPVFYGPGYYAPVPYGPYYGSPYIRYLREKPEATWNESFEA